MKIIKGHWQMFLITLAVYTLWNTPVIYPFKMLVIFLHELSHGLAGVLSGGSILSITLDPREGGLARVLGGNAFLIFSAGYLGSLMFGVLILLVALWTKADRFILGLFGAIILLVTALYIRDPFPLGYCILAGMFMLLSAWFLGNRVNDLILRVIGLSSIIYAPYDIFSDTIARSQLRSDARMLSEHVGGTTMFWGGLWLAISLVVIVLCLRFAFGEDSNLHRFSLGKSSDDSPAP
ncbi:MAG: M50 family metallopeptidase [Nitratireductor sp.]